MTLPLRIQFSSTAAKYVSGLDRPTKSRLAGKLDQIAAAPYDVQHSKPLTATEKRSARVGKYRLLLLIEVHVNCLRVVDVASRGQIYRSL